MAREKAKLVIAEKTKIKKEMSRAELPVEDSAPPPAVVLGGHRVANDPCPLFFVRSRGGNEHVMVFQVCLQKTAQASFRRGILGDHQEFLIPVSSMNASSG